VLQRLDFSSRYQAVCNLYIIFVVVRMITMYLCAGLCARAETLRQEMVLRLFPAYLETSFFLIMRARIVLGTGGESIYGEKFEDEGFPVNHTRPFLLSMV